MRCNSLAALAVALCIGLGSSASAQLKTETFDTEASAAANGWKSFGPTRDAALGTDFGWSNSNLAGGSAGEAGGVVDRIDMLTAYLDDTVGTITLNDDFEAHGKFWGENISLDGGFAIGFWDIPEGGFIFDGLHGNYSSYGQGYGFSRIRSFARGLILTRNYRLQSNRLNRQVDEVDFFLKNPGQSRSPPP